MKNGKAGTRARSHAEGLTLDQQNAVDLLACGKNDTEVAKKLRVNRVSVTRWRLYSPEFRAALAVRRADIWGAAADRLRALIPRALDLLAEAIDDADPSDRVTVALAVLKLAGPLPLAPDEPTDPEEIVREVTERERERAKEHTNNHDSVDASLYDLPKFADHQNTVQKRLALLSATVPNNEQQPVLEQEAEPR